MRARRSSSSPNAPIFEGKNRRLIILGIAIKLAELLIQNPRTARDGSTGDCPLMPVTASDKTRMASSYRPCAW